MFDIDGEDIAKLNDTDLRILVGRLVEADLKRQGKELAGLNYSGNQNAPDGGLDVYVEMNGEERDDTFVPRRVTGFQVKLPNMGPANIMKEMRPKGKLRTSISEIAKKGGAYIIVCSKGSVSYSALKSRIKSMYEAVSDCEDVNKIKLEFYDRNKIATWVRQYPGVILWVQNRLGTIVSGWRGYEDWSSNPQDEEGEFFYDDTPCMYEQGKESSRFTVMEGINYIRKQLLVDGSCVRLAGLSGTGKTRLLKALFDNRIGENALNRNNVIYCDAGNNPVPAILHVAEKYVIQKEDIILAIDNCSPEEHSKICELCTRLGSKVKLITIEYDVKEDAPKETKSFYLEPSSRESIIRVIKSRKSHISDNDIKLIADFSDGNYRIAFALAETIMKGQSINGLDDNQLFERLFRQRHQENDELLRIAEILSILYSFDSTYGGDELKKLASLLGVSEITLLRNISELESRKLIQKRGKWKALLPHAIANKLAIRALKALPLELVLDEFSIENESRITKSFIHRISFLHNSKEAVSLVNKYVDIAIKNNKPTNIYSSFYSYLNYLAPVSPEKIIDLTEYILERPNGMEILLENYRANYISIIGAIGYDKVYFEKVVEILGKIAISDNRKSRDAVDELSSMFCLKLSGTEASVEQKLRAINKMILSENSKVIELGMTLLGEAISINSHGRGFRMEFGARHRDYKLRFTADEFKEHYNSFLNYIVNLIKSKIYVSGNLKEILAQHSTEYMYSLEIFDMLLNAVYSINEETKWVEGWVPCLRFLRIHKEKVEPELKRKIKELSDGLAPVTLEEKIFVFALAPLWGYRDIAEYIDGEYSEANINGYVIKLGMELIIDNELLDTILPVLLRNRNPSRVYHLGGGLAYETNNKIETWEKILKVYINLNKTNRSVELLRGFIHELSFSNPEICETILDSILTSGNMNYEFISLQTEVNESEFSHNRILISLLKTDVNIWSYEVLSRLRCDYYNNQYKFIELMECIRRKDNSEQLVTQMLLNKINDLQEENTDYSIISDYIIKFIEKFPYDNDYLTDDGRANDIGMLIIACINSIKDYTDEIFRLYKLIYQRVLDGSLWSFRISGILYYLVSAFPVMLLEVFLPDGLELDHNIIECLNVRHNYSFNVIGRIPNKLLIDWADVNNEERYFKLSKLISAYYNNNDVLYWNEFALELLEKVKNPTSLLDNYYQTFSPMDWSGSLSEVIRTRLPLLKKLQEKYEGEILIWAIDKYNILENEIIRIEKREIEEEKERTERFE